MIQLLKVLLYSITFSYEAPGDCGEENLLLQLQQLFKQLSEKAATTGGITKSLGIRNGSLISFTGQDISIVISHSSKHYFHNSVFFFKLQVFEQQDAVEYYRRILKAVGTHASKVCHTLILFQCE